MEPRAQSYDGVTLRVDGPLSFKTATLGHTRANLYSPRTRDLDSITNQVDVVLTMNGVVVNRRAGFIAGTGKTFHVRAGSATSVPAYVGLYACTSQDNAPVPLPEGDYLGFAVLDLGGDARIVSEPFTVRVTTN